MGPGGCCSPAPRSSRRAWPSSRRHGERWCSPGRRGGWPAPDARATPCLEGGCGWPPSTGPRRRRHDRSSSSRSAARWGVLCPGSSPAGWAPGESGGPMAAYVPEVVRARLAAGQAEWLGELRRVTPLFLNLLDADPARADLLEVVQPAIAALQPILRLHEGSLKQVVVEEKGLTLIAVFGLPPLAHEDDAARAAKAALKAQAALRDLGTRC